MNYLLYALIAYTVLSLPPLAWLAYQRFRPAQPAPVATMGAPIPNAGEIDEFLDADFRPFIPPQFIPAGMNPTGAVRAKMLAEGKMFHSRRVTA